MELMHKETQKFLTEYLGHADFKLDPIKKGGSDRQFFRVTLPDKTSFIFMHYGDEVEENAHWININRFMASLDIFVPRIVAQDVSRHFILLEDLGDVDLWSKRFLPWAQRRDYYFQVLTQIHRLHSFELKSLPADLQLSESYGPRLYKWEHEYFLESLVGEVCKIKLSLCGRVTLKNWRSEPPFLIVSSLKSALPKYSLKYFCISLCIISMFLSFRTSEARPGIQYY